MKVFGNQLQPILPIRCPDKRAIEIWHRYALQVQQDYGLDITATDYLGAIGANVATAEYLLRGSQIYSDSLVPAARNMWYSAFTVPTRYINLTHHGLVEPILDYGCGVGFTLMWMSLKGHEELYGWDVPGAQSNIAKAVLSESGIEWWDRETPARFGTIVCLNVLEHVPEPMKVLTWLRSMTDNLIANCDMNDDEADKSASTEERLAVVESLKERGESYLDYDAMGEIPA